MMHCKELCHGKNDACIPRDGKRGEHHVEEESRHEKHSQLDIPLSGLTPRFESNVRYSRTSPSGFFRLEPSSVTTFFNTFPRTNVFELDGHITRGTALIVEAPFSNSRRMQTLLRTTAHVEV
jgi:hypothetical protein